MQRTYTVNSNREQPISSREAAERLVTHPATEGGRLSDQRAGHTCIPQALTEKPLESLGILTLGASKTELSKKPASSRLPCATFVTQELRTFHALVTSGLY